MPRVADDEFEDDEDWYDGDDEPDDDEAVPCPECRRPVPGFLDKCPGCGYWLSDADRRRLRPSASKPKWVLITAAILLVVSVLLLPGVWHLLFE